MDEKMKDDRNARVKTIVEVERDPEIMANGNKAFNAALYVVQQHVDPAFAYIIYRFNRLGIKHDKLDAVCFIDKDGTPTLGINYAKFIQYQTVAQIGIIEHAVGHFSTGHVGNRLGFELREYCEGKYGKLFGQKLYYLTTEMVADAFVSYPGALREAGRPVYDVQKLGLNRWSDTMNVLDTIENLIEKKTGGAMQNMQALEEAIKSIAGEMGYGESDVDNGDMMAEMESMEVETSGNAFKDAISHGSKSESMQGEEKIREIVKKAFENTTSNKDRGYLEGDIGQFIEAEEAQPVIPYFNLLSQCVANAISENRKATIRRLNRRNEDYGFGRVYENVTTACMIIDTSGSMGSDVLCKVDAQLRYLIQQVEEVWVIHNDAEVAMHELYRRGMTLENFFGRGGTSFEPALEFVRDELEGGIPDLTVFLTDGYGGKLDDSNPIIGDWETKLVWVLTPNGMSEDEFRNNITSTGTVIKVEEW